MGGVCLLFVYILRVGSLHSQKQEKPQPWWSFSKQSTLQTEVKLHLASNKASCRGKKRLNPTTTFWTSNFDKSSRHTRARGKCCSDNCKAAAEKWQKRSKWHRQKDKQTLCTHSSLNLVLSPFSSYTSLHAKLLRAQSSPVLSTPNTCPESLFLWASVFLQCEGGHPVSQSLVSPVWNAIPFGRT